MAIIMFGLGAALVAMIVGIGLVFSKDVRVLIDLRSHERASARVTCRSAGVEVGHGANGAEYKGRGLGNVLRGIRVGGAIE